MEWYWAFALLLGMVISMMAIGIPVALAFLTTNIVGWLFFNDWNPFAVHQVVDNSTILITRFTLGPVPMFIMMGSLFFHTGLAIRVFDALEALFGRLPGRLCYLTVVGGALFSTLTGSSMANTAMLGQQQTQRGLVETSIATAQGVVDGRPVLIGGAPRGSVDVSGFLGWPFAGSAVVGVGPGQDLLNR